MSVKTRPVLETGSHLIGSAQNYSELGQQIRLNAIAQTARLATIGAWLVPLLLFVLDYGVIVAALNLTELLRQLLGTVWETKSFALDPVSHYLLFPSIYLSLIIFENLYTKRHPFWQCVRRHFGICTQATIMILAISFLTGRIGSYPRLFFVLNWFISLVAMTSSRYLAKQLLVRTGLWQKPSLFIGPLRAAEQVDAAFKEEVNMGYRVVAVVDEHSRQQYSPYLQFTDIGEAMTLIHSRQIEDVILSAQGLGKEQLLVWVERLQPFVKNLSVMPDLNGIPVNNMEVCTFINQKAILLNVPNNLALWYNRLLKRIFDLTLGSLLLISLLPLLAVLWFWIKIDSKGPALYNAMRIGKDGKGFVCFKFRTMQLGGDALLTKYLAEHPEAGKEWERFAKLKSGDPRVTPAGRWLRKLSLDELPQLFNVLIGEMSLVGPRPYLPRERALMGEYYKTIIQTVPGITGLWQTQGRNDVEFGGRLKLDRWYVRNWSLWLDVTLLMKTVRVVMRQKGAF